MAKIGPVANLPGHLSVSVRSSAAGAGYRDRAADGPERPACHVAFAVASLAATGPQAKQFVQALWDAPIPSGEQRYYDGMLYMMSLLHCSGEFRNWAPK
ncbi:MAG: hypothetical protein ACYCPD_02635 [Acidobacteriaceae bacterium]